MAEATPVAPRPVAAHPVAQGRLDVVATPIGNLGDFSPRAREALERADVIAAEDTRRTGQLLSAAGLRRPLLSLHEHNELDRVEELLARLRGGAVVALVSDAGTPLLSDPGFALVRAAAAAGIEVRAIPGPTAIAAALSIAGIATDRFCFEGFLPARRGERQQRLAALRAEPRTLVFFESPHRIVEVLQDAAAHFGAQREAALARELTKAFETTYRGTLTQLLEAAQADADMARGEITLVVAGAPHSTEEGGEPAIQAMLDRVLRVLTQHLPPSRAAAAAADIVGVKRAQAYAAALRIAGRKAGPGGDDNAGES